MSGHGVAEQDDMSASDLEKPLPAVELRPSGGVQALDGDAVAHDCTPAKSGVVSVVPSPRSSSVVAPMVSAMRPPSGTVSR